MVPPGRPTVGSNMSASQLRQQPSRSWAIPLAYVVATLVVGMTFPRLEHQLLPDLVSTVTPGAAMTIASAIASGMIALTGVVFSLVFVMVQFSATAYSPRLVLWVARDPVIGHSLGIFSSTFLYSLFLLAWVDRSASGRVPLISMWMTVALLIASVGMFVALLERVGMLQVNRMLITTSRRGRASIEELYPPVGRPGSPAQPADYEGLPVTQTVRHRGVPQVIQSFNLAALTRLAAEAGAVIEMTAAPGDTVLELMTLLQVRGARQAIDETALTRAIHLGDERTFEQDPKYALRLLVDIAIKALSPAINDPTTAVQALDQIEDLLIRMGRRDLDVGGIRDAQGALRVVVPYPTWNDLLLLALDEIRSCGASSLQVMRRMNALIANLTEVLPAERHPALRHVAKRLKGTVARSFADLEEQQDASVADRQGLGIPEEETPGAA